MVLLQGMAEQMERVGHGTGSAGCCRAGPAGSWPEVTLHGRRRDRLETPIEVLRFVFLPVFVNAVCLRGGVLLLEEDTSISLNIELKYFSLSLIIVNVVHLGQHRQHQKGFTVCYLKHLVPLCVRC